MIYGSVEDATSYHTARNNDEQWDAVTDKQAALQRGSDYIDFMYRSRFPGYKVGRRQQEREWPRYDAYDEDDNLIESDEVPTEVIHATYEAALREGSNPGSLMPDYVASDQVVSEKYGPVSFQYAQPSGAESVRPVVGIIGGILQPILTVMSGSKIAGATARV